MGYRIAVVGATGNVGREMLHLLAERKFPADEVIPLASARSEGDPIDFNGRPLEVKNLATFDFEGCRHRLFVARRQGLEGLCAESRHGWLPRHRQHQPVPHGH